MGQLKLRSFSSADANRLGDLLARAKQGLASGPEESELLKLLMCAEEVSRTNARTIARLREKPLQAKSS